VASALHQHSEDYVVIIMFILNSTALSKQLEADTNTGWEVKEVVALVVDCLKVQINNFRILLNCEIGAQGSSLVEAPSSRFDELPDILPAYSDRLTFFEGFHIER